jgi:hypothetical protein
MNTYIKEYNGFSAAIEGQKKLRKRTWKIYSDKASPGFFLANSSKFNIVNSD